MVDDGATPNPDPEDEERRRRRRPIAWWWWAGGAGLAVLILAAIAFSVAGGGDGADGDDRAFAPAANGSQQSSGGSAAATSTAAPAGTAAGRDGGDSGASAGDGERPSIEGIWEFIVDVTEANGACAGEEDEPLSIDSVTIRRLPGGNYSVSGLGTNPDDAWNGDWQGDQFVFNGERAEDDGLTTATFFMRFEDGGALRGSEEWIWDSRDGSCSDGKSSVEAFFFAPLD